MLTRSSFTSSATTAARPAFSGRTFGITEGIFQSAKNAVHFGRKAAQDQLPSRILNPDKDLFVVAAGDDIYPYLGDAGNRLDYQA